MEGPPEKTAYHSQAEPDLSHMTRAMLEPTAMRWRAILSTNY